jgi:hypothetical protein
MSRKDYFRVGDPTILSGTIIDPEKTEQQLLTDAKPIVFDVEGDLGEQNREIVAMKAKPVSGELAGISCHFSGITAEQSAPNVITVTIWLVDTDLSGSGVIGWGGP